MKPPVEGEVQPNGDHHQAASGAGRRTTWRWRRWSLFRRLLIYHLLLAGAVVLVVLLFPALIDHLPIGGVSHLAAGGDVRISSTEVVPGATGDGAVVHTAADSLDRLGYARRLAVTLLGTWLLMLPVSWVHKSIYRASTYDHSLDETTLLLPGVVAAIVIVVQHSLALAFSLAGIVAGVQFRRALQDTFDTLFILVAIGTGIAAGVEALEIAAVLTVFFSYATLYVYRFGDGLEADYLARRKEEKHRRKQGGS